MKTSLQQFVNMSNIGRLVVLLKKLNNPVALESWLFTLSTVYTASADPGSLLLISLPAKSGPAIRSQVLIMTSSRDLFEWTTGGDPTLRHKRKIAVGAVGAAGVVHEVLSCNPPLLLLTFTVPR